MRIAVFLISLALSQASSAFTVEELREMAPADAVRAIVATAEAMRDRYISCKAHVRVRRTRVGEPACFLQAEWIGQMEVIVGYLDEADMGRLRQEAGQFQLDRLRNYIDEISEIEHYIKASLGE